ncbi:MAG: GNAT family N-acetyltransferase [Leptolyngbya sp. SIOISBB]|nr:GNAT family N-acetyltransferase [Leptolyngbya sp. SIOISBB]
MSVTVRLGRHEELETLIELQSAAILQSRNPAYDAKQRQLVAQHQAAVRRSSLDEIILVAEHNGQLVGFSSLLNHRPRIAALYVHPQWWHQKIGSTLLKAVEDLARRRHCKQVDVISSLAAATFYQQWGYCKLRNQSISTRSRQRIPCELLRKNLIPMTRLATMQCRAGAIAAWLRFTTAGTIVAWIILMAFLILLLG